MRSIDTPWEKDEILFLGEKHRCKVQTGESYVVVYDDMQKVCEYFGSGILILSCFASSHAQLTAYLESCTPSRCIRVKNGKSHSFMITNNDNLLSVGFNRPKEKLFKISKNDYKDDRGYFYRLIFKQDNGGETTNVSIHKDKKPPDYQHNGYRIKIKSFSYYNRLFNLYEGILKDAFNRCTMG